MVGFVVFVHDEQHYSNNTQLAELIKHGQSQFKTATTDGISIRYLSRRHRMHPVSSTTCLYKVVEALSLPDIHRLPVLENGRVTAIISQSSIVKYLSQKISIGVDNSSDPTIGELGIATHPVLSVNKSESVINTFRKMENRQKTGIAIVDESGKLVGATTAKDLGLFIKNPTLQLLQGNILDYLKIIRQQSLDERTPSISLPLTEKLSRAVGCFAATKVHRIFIVSNDELVSVLSITDIFKFLIKK